MASIFNTKCHLLIKIKDYPVGKNLKCYVWLEGVLKDEEINNKVKNCLTLSETYKDYVVRDIEVVNTLVTNGMKSEEKFGEIMLQSITNVYEGNPKKKKNKKINHHDIKFSELTDKEIEDIDNKIKKEKFKRQNGFDEAEYIFWSNNSGEIKIEDVKEVYKKCDGDIFKLRKARIRENISNILESKKVAE